MPNEILHGYLVLADISGYTSYLAGTELDHAHEILTDLLETLVDHLKPFLTISKLEGDAVFARATVQELPRGETLLELVESTYVAFRDRREAIRRGTSCTCNACRNIPSLDLKFIVHYGEYMLQTVRTIVEPIGSDVNLAHRLMKNNVHETTGWAAYALYTQQTLKHIGITPEQTRTQTESYEHLGEVTIQCVDLHERYEQITQARHVFLSPAEAHRVLEFDYAAPPQVIWDWFNDPAKRGLWMHSQVQPILRIGGRLAPGARNHCVHGKNEVVVEDVLDIKPFEYYTVDHTPQGSPVVLRMTFQFKPTDSGGTHFTLTLACRGKGMPQFVARKVTDTITDQTIKPAWSLDKIDSLILNSDGVASSLGE